MIFSKSYDNIISEAYMVKKLLTSVFIVFMLIITTVAPVFADTGSFQFNLPFAILFGVLTPFMIGFIIYYVVVARKCKKQNSDETEKPTKIVRINDDED